MGPALDCGSIIKILHVKLMMKENFVDETLMLLSALCQTPNKPMGSVLLFRHLGKGCEEW